MYSLGEAALDGLDEEEDDDDEEDVDSDEDNENDPTDFEKIFNERSNALVSVSSSKLTDDSTSLTDKKPRKANKKTTQLAFDFAFLRLLELEMTIKLKNNLQNCSKHGQESDRGCFDCSLINIIQ